MLEEIDGDRIRLTRSEIEQDRSLGLNTSWVRTKHDLSIELVNWIRMVGNHRPEIIEKLANAARKDPALKDAVSRFTDDSPG
ncbi:MAG: hypothetical protein R8K47_03320 [Mariprofundaceae bacterium]